jgi:hypothetical protein
MCSSDISTQDITVKCETVLSHTAVMTLRGIVTRYFDHIICSRYSGSEWIIFVH